MFELDERFDGVVARSVDDAQVSSALLRTIHPKDSHAANLAVLPTGDLLCTWFNGPGEGDPDTTVVLARLPAGSTRWSEAVALSNDPDRSEQNPVLFLTPGGALWLLHTSNEPHNQKTSRVISRISDDGGLTWGDREVLFDEAGTFLRCPPVVLASGEWLLPIYHCEPGGERSAVKISSDEGKTWNEFEIPDSAGRVQLTAVETAPGELFGLLRSRDADRIYATRSTDSGRGWSAPVKTELPNNNSSIQMIRLADGRLALIFNDATTERDQVRWLPKKDGGLRAKAVRTPLTVALSEDGGRTWPYLRNVQMADEEYVENPLGYSYPSIVQSADGALHLAFSYLRKTIKYLRITPDWIVAGSR